MIFIHSFISLNQSNFSFPTHSSSMCLFCQLINQSLFDSKLVVCSLSIHQSISSINQWNEINQTNQLSFLLHTLFSINQCQSSVISSSSILSFHLSSLSNQIQSINQKRSIDRQDRRTDMNEWMNWNQSHWQVNSCAIDHRESIRSCLIVYFLFQLTN